MKSDDAYMQALGALGVAPGDIDFVMCTHLHSDHVGWNTRLEGGRWVPTFPNAETCSPRGSSRRGARAPEVPALPARGQRAAVIAAGKALLVTNDHALDDEVWLEPTPGHTPDHVAICLASRGERAVMCGDVMHSPVQCLHPEWTAWPDWDPDQAKRTRRAFMERYCDTDTLICTTHFPLPSIGRIVADGDAFRFEFDDATGWRCRCAAGPPTQSPRRPSGRKPERIEHGIDRRLHQGHGCGHARPEAPPQRPRPAMDLPRSSSRSHCAASAFRSGAGCRSRAT